MYVQMHDIYQKYQNYRKKSDIFENITIFSNPAVIQIALCGFSTERCIKCSHSRQMYMCAFSIIMYRK